MRCEYSNGVLKYNYTKEEVQKLCDSLAFVGGSCLATLYDELAADLGKRHGLIFAWSSSTPQNKADFVGGSWGSYVSAWRKVGYPSC